MTPSAPAMVWTRSNDEASSCAISAGTPAPSCTRGRATALLVEDTRSVRGRVDVLAQDQAVLEREHVDPIPLDAPSFAIRRGRRPLADHETVPGVQTSPGEPQVRVALEDARDVQADGVALDPVAGGVVLEHHP